MSCKRLGPALRRHAFGFPLSTSQREHVDCCAACSSVLREETRRAGAIDGALVDLLLVDPDPAALERVRLALSRATDASRARVGAPGATRRRLRLALAGILVASVVLAGWLVRPSLPTFGSRGPAARATNAEIPVVSTADLEGFTPVGEMMLTRLHKEEQ